MTVKELIKKLSAVKDKDRIVVITSFGWDNINTKDEVTELENLKGHEESGYFLKDDPDKCCHGKKSRKLLELR
jgi:hypothetical protein